MWAGGAGGKEQIFSLGSGGIRDGLLSPARSQTPNVLAVGHRAGLSLEGSDEGAR